MGQNKSREYIYSSLEEFIGSKISFFSSLALFFVLCVLHFSFNESFLSSQSFSLLVVSFLFIFVSTLFRRGRLFFLFSAAIVANIYLFILAKENASSLPLMNSFVIYFSLFVASVHIGFVFSVSNLLFLIFALTLWNLSSFGLSESSVKVASASGILFLSFASFFLCCKIIADTHYKKLINQLKPQESYDEARVQGARLQTIGKMSVSLVHEIANPVNNIGGYSYQIKSLMEESPVNQKLLTEANGRINYNLIKIKEIISTMKSFSKPNREKKMSLIDPFDVIDDVSVLCEQHVKTKNINFKIYTEKLEEPFNKVFVNKSELSQVLVNFVMNALDQSQAVSAPEIILGFQLLKDSKCRFYVEDKAGGVKASDQKNLFQAFYTTKEKTGGTGLGLYISSLIAKKNDAEIGVKNVQNKNSKGACFYFDLQLRSAQLSQEGDEIQVAA